MFRISYLRSLAGILAVVMAFSGLPLEAKNKKAEKLVKDGRLAEAKKDYDRALELYEQALATEPSDAGYILLTQRARFYAAQLHIEAGQKARTKGDLDLALAEFTKAMQKDPGSAMAIQEWKRTQEMVDRNKKTGASQDTKSLTPQQLAQKHLEDRIASMAPPPELKPVSKRIDTLKMNNQPPKVLFETLCKMAGVNVVFDQQFGTTGGRTNFNVDLSNTNLESALDYLSVLTKAFWKPLNENTVFVAEDNVTKRRDYVDNVVRVFYIKNATSVQEFQEVATAVRSVTEIRRVYTYNAQKAILVRGTADAVALAEKLINDIDKPKAEVVIDIMVMEVNSTRTRQLAATIVDAKGNAGINLPVGYAPRNGVTSTTGSGTGTGTTTTTTTTTGTGLTLSNIGKTSLNDFQTSLPGALLNAVASDNTTRILQRPQVRASDGQKVTLKIGDKVPIATGSFTPSLGAVSTTAGTGLISSTQFNFTDVGIILDLTPQVHGTEEVTLKMSVEVSTIGSHVSIGGIDQPVIGQRKTETELRLREGEVNILGGLMNSQDSRTMAGIPGLINIPVLNKFFGNESLNKTQQDVLIAIVPHIVRAPVYSESNLREISAGNETDIKIRRLVEPGDGGTGAPAPAPAAVQQQVTPLKVTTPQTSPVVPATPADTAPPAAAPAPASGQPEGLRVNFTPGGEVPGMVGGAVMLTMQIDRAKDLFAGESIKIKFPAALLRLNDVLQGEMLSREGQKVIFSKDIRNDAGEATVTVKRLPGSPGVNGSGTLLSFVFMATAKGAGVVQFEEAAFKTSQLQPINATPAKVSVRIE